MIDDRAEPGGSVLELANRPPEEWEHHRPLSVAHYSHSLFFRTAAGELEIVANQWAPEGRGFLGQGHGVVFVSPASWAQLNADMAAQRAFDASFRR